MVAMDMKTMELMEARKEFLHRFDMNLLGKAPFCCASVGQKESMVSFEKSVQGFLVAEFFLP